MISNPDMLHVGMLAFHPKWETFFTNLTYVVLDEVHTYRGVFGSHVANLLRRLLRVAEHLRRPAADHRLLGDHRQPRRARGAAHRARAGGRSTTTAPPTPAAPSSSSTPRGARPPRSPRSCCARRCARTSRRSSSPSRARTPSWSTPGRCTATRRLRKLVSAYRSGYLPEERREIEEKLFSGALKAVVSTSALEMGIDIGGLDVCILVGYPGSITTTWQRGGRVGRQDRESLVILLAGPDALDQYFMKHPRVFFESGFEPAVINPENLPVLAAHLACAAAELPLRKDDAWFPFRGRDGSTAVADAIALLERSGDLVRAVGEDAWHSVKRSPQRDVNIRGVGESYTIFEETADAAPAARGPTCASVGARPRRAARGPHRAAPPEEREPPLSPPAGRGRRGRGAGEEAPAPGAKPRVIGSLDGNRAFSEGHPGAIYLHRAAQYQVTRLDLDRHNLYARPVDVDYYTLPHREKETEILATRRSKLVKNFVCRLGELKVTERTVGYEKKRVSSRRAPLGPRAGAAPDLLRDGRPLDRDRRLRPARRRAPRGSTTWAASTRSSTPRSRSSRSSRCASATTSAASARRCTSRSRKGAVFIYDGYAGGVGLAEASFARIGELLERTLELIASCDCECGCPACIYSNKCGNGNVPLDKEAAVTVLKLLLDHPDAQAWREAADAADEEPEEAAGRRSRRRSRPTTRRASWCSTSRRCAAPTRSAAGTTAT